MPFNLKTADAEAELYGRLENIETLKEDIMPGLVKALANTPAYVGDVAIVDGGAKFCIDFHQIGDDKHISVCVTFAKDPGRDDYMVVHHDKCGCVLSARRAGRDKLIDAIASVLLRKVESNGDNGSFLTAWQANARDATDALKELFGSEDKVRVEYIKNSNGKDTMSTAMVWYGDQRLVGFEFEGPRRYRAVWHAFGEAIDSGCLEGTVKDVVSKYKEDIADAVNFYR